MANLFKWDAGKYNALMGKFAVRLTVEEGERLNDDPLLIDAMIAHMRGAVSSPPLRQNANPFEQTVEEQLAALRRQNELGGWGIDEDVFARLAETAPEWPEGRDAYRSFCIRFGEGRGGVIKTFEAHAEAVKRVHKSWRWDLLLSGEHPYQGKYVDRLRLLGGNDSHHATVEWVIIPDLSAHRKRESITSVREPRSLADEGLVLAWLVPNRVRAIDYDEWCAWFCAGYELNVPERDDGPWRSVPLVGRALNGSTAGLRAGWRSHAGSDYSVPPVG